MSTDTMTSRRQFLKITSIAGGGMMIGFSFSGSAKDTSPETAAFMPNSYITIAGDGTVNLDGTQPRYRAGCKNIIAYDHCGRIMH